MKNTHRTSLPAVLAVSMLLPVATAVAAPLSDDAAATESATIVSQRLPWYYTTLFLNTAQEARILKIDGQRSSSFYSASLAAGAHTLRVGTSCWYQVIERVNERTLEVQLDPGQRYKLAVDIDRAGECVPRLVKLKAGEAAPSGTSGKAYRVQSSPSSLMSIM